MKLIPLALYSQYSYHYTGKFKALSSEWQHNKTSLKDYELIIMTEGELYLRYNGHNYTVKKGEYLLLPPSSEGYREGFKKAYCSFYWMHFATEHSSKVPYEISSGSPKIKEIDTSKYGFIPQNGTIASPERILVMMKQLQDMVKNNYPTVSLNAMVTIIMMELYGEITVGAPSTSDPAAKKKIYMYIIDYIQTNISKNINI